jgi:5-(carboxyamino)imidazole ribonucleotide synthase
MRVLIYGAGQLAKMMYLAGAPLGIQVQAVDVGSGKVLDPESQQQLPLSIAEAIDEADVLSVEFEHVPEALLHEAELSGKLIPSMRAILTGADRVREKSLLDKLDIANSAYHVITDIEQLDKAVEELGEQLIIKSSRDGYDGYGQWRLESKEQLIELKEALASLNLQKIPLIAEKMIPFEREVSIIAVRSQDGSARFYPLAENLHYKGQLHVSVAPALKVTETLQQQAEEAVTKLGDELGYVGVLAVEFFQVGDQLLVNEIAPRVHNSGHWTQQGADTCQFENHLRAICNLPVGDTKAVRHAAMINIIGVGGFNREMLAIHGCHLHWYRKEAREKRKMGHINLCADSYAELGRSMLKLSEYLPIEHFPKLKSSALKLSKS